MLGMGQGILHYQGDTTTQVVADKYFGRVALNYASICSIQVNFNPGTAAGALFVQGSNHEDPSDLVAGLNEWETLDVVFPRAVISGAGQAAISLSHVGFRWIRIFFDHTGGSGVMEVCYFVKDGL